MHKYRGIIPEYFWVKTTNLDKCPSLELTE